MIGKFNPWGISSVCVLAKDAEAKVDVVCRRGVRLALKLRGGAENV